MHTERLVVAAFFFISLQSHTKGSEGEKQQLLRIPQHVVWIQVERKRKEHKLVSQVMEVQKVSCTATVGLVSSRVRRPTEVNLVVMSHNRTGTCEEQLCREANVHDNVRDRG